jgi:ribokinase
MNKKIVVIGSSNTDMVASVSEFPKPGETIIGDEFMMNAGGKGANQAVAAARSGGDVTFISKVGNDQTGNQSIQNLKNEGINTSRITRDDEKPSGVALILVNSAGENIIVVAPGSNMSLNEEDIDNSEEEINAAGVVLMQLEVPLKTVVYAAQKSYSLGKKVILNPAPAAELPDDLYPNLYMITPNETETEILTGIKVTDEITAAKAAEVFKKKGVDIVIITMGADGAYIHSDDLKAIIPAPKVKAVDTTAAGDCFNGALSVGISHEIPLDEAVLFANKAAALSVTKMGAQKSLPYKDDMN